MIKNSSLFYAPSGTGKTTFLQRVWDQDRHRDLAVNFNRSYAQIKDEDASFRTRPYLVTPDRKTSALSLSGQPAAWAGEIAIYRKKRPVVEHLLLDEVQCAEPVYLTQLIMLARAIYHSRVPVIMCGLMTGTFSGVKKRLPQMVGLAKITENVQRYRRPDDPFGRH